VHAQFRIEKVDISTYEVPTDAPESDGTFEWKSTTMILARIQGGGCRGIGYSYTDRSAAELARHVSARLVGRDLMDIEGAHCCLAIAVRNIGRAGVASTAISALDTALWDLKARVLGVSLVALLGGVRDRLPIYGSGGFTSYSDEQLAEQFRGWAEQGIRMMKMKVGREPDRDPHRVRRACDVIGSGVQLFVDANGALSRKEALRLADIFAESDVRWFEEPVSSDDLAGLRLLRDSGPAGMDISAGEYAYTLDDFRRLLEAGAVDVLQADATRCAGITGFLKAAALCEAFHVPLSSHCAPALHLHPGCAVGPMRHAEYFHDHVRIERMFFDGIPPVREGALRPDRSSPGNGLIFKEADAAQYRVN